VLSKINFSNIFKYLSISFLYSFFLYLIMFKFFNSYTNYYLCTRIESFNVAFFDIKLNYLYTRSCDEEPYFLTLQNIENLYSIQDFQYQNRPIFLILAWLIYKFINLFNSDKLESNSIFLNGFILSSETLLNLSMFSILKN